MTVRASTLISVQWPPEPVSPGPDTLVLSCGTYYVDLRINRDDGSIYWALAGRRIVVSEEPKKVKFTHEIDSHDTTSTSSNTDHDSKEKGEEEDEVADEGLFTKLPNGDDLEVGEMPAPHLGGKVAPYREVWRELSIAHDSDKNNGGGGGDTTCWMLESLETEKQQKRRTFYCRVGKFFLALRRTERQAPDQSGLLVEFSGIRQEEIRSQRDGTREWTTKYSIGSEVDHMFHMSTSEYLLENITSGDSGWNVDDKVVVKDKSNGAIREVCVVRAVN